MKWSVIYNDVEQFILEGKYEDVVKEARYRLTETYGDKFSGEFEVVQYKKYR
jgi:hypothetical protein